MHLVTCCSALAPPFHLKRWCSRFISPSKLDLFFKTVHMCHHSVKSFLILDTNDYYICIYYAEKRILIHLSLTLSHKFLGSDFGLFTFVFSEIKKIPVTTKCSTNMPMNLIATKNQRLL